MLAAVIRTILKDEALAPSTNDKVILREANKEGEIVTKFEVVDMLPGVTTIQVEKLVGGMSSLPGVAEGPWKQKCDYLLVCEYQGKDVAMLIELKKTLRSKQKEKGMEQLRRSLPLLDYLCSMCRIHQGMKPDKSGVDARYFLIGEKGNQSLDKQRVKQGGRIPTEKHKGITVHILHGQSIRFERLLSV